MLPYESKCSQLKELYLYYYTFRFFMTSKSRRIRKFVVQIKFRKSKKELYFFNNFSIISSYDCPFFPAELSLSLVLSFIRIVVYPSSFFSILLYLSYIFYRYYRLFISFSANIYIPLIYNFYRFYRPLESGTIGGKQKCMK